MGFRPPRFVLRYLHRIIVKGLSIIYPQQPTSMLANVKNRIIMHIRNTMHDLRETIYLNKLYTQFNLTNNTLSLRTSVYLFVASGVLQFSISHHSHIFD